MNEPITLPAPTLEPATPARTKWECEYHAFRRLLPDLLRTHRGQFVAIHDQQVVGTGPDKLALALEVLAKTGNCAIHVGLVSEQPDPVFRSGVRREVARPGGAV
jgi:hypothetical protein